MERFALRNLGGRAAALAALSGVLYALGFCGFDHDLLAWICLVPVLAALDDDALSPKQAALLGWLAGLVTHLLTYTWIVGMLRRFAYLPWPVAVLGYFLLCLAQSSLFAAWGWGVHALRRRGMDPIWAAPIAMVLVEWLWPALFPSYLANSQYQQLWLLQVLDLCGPLGLSFLLALVSAVAYALLAWGLGRRARPAALPVLVCLGLVLGSAGYGQVRMSDWGNILARGADPIRVGMAQANMGVYFKRDAPEEGLRRHRDQSLELEAQGADLIVWPESGYYYGIDASMRDLKRHVLGPLSTPLLFGGLRVEGRPSRRRYYNAAFLLDGAGQLQGTYDKTFLLAFGEYLPGGSLLPFLYALSPQSGHMTPGEHTRPLVLGGIRYGTLICYEDILPRFVRRVMQHQPHVLVNLTNDAWFGRTLEPRIHLALASFRAIEQRRYLVRSTNTGISAVIDPMGRIVASAPMFARANLLAEVLPLTGITPYQRLGDWVGGLALALACFYGRQSGLDLALRVRARLTRRRRAAR